MMYQNRSSEELRRVLEQFLVSLEAQHNVSYKFEDLFSIVNQVLSQKIHRLIEIRMNDFSIPELMKIVDLIIIKKTPPPEPKKPIKKKPALQ